MIILYILAWLVAGAAVLWLDVFLAMRGWFGSEFNFILYVIQMMTFPKEETWGNFFSFVALLLWPLVMLTWISKYLAYGRARKAWEREQNRVQ